MKCVVKTSVANRFDQIECGDRAVMQLKDLSTKKSIFMCGIHAWDWKKYIEEGKSTQITVERKKKRTVRL